MKGTKHSIVFCHGIWAEGSCLGKVIPALQAEGHQCIAAQYSLNTTADDVATVKRTLGRVSSPVPAVALPDAHRVARQKLVASLGYSGNLHGLPKVQHSRNVEDAGVSNFKKQLDGLGGRSFEVADASAAQARVGELFPAAKVVCSTVPEVPGNRRIESASDPHSLNDVDVGVVRSTLGVAEAGAVWLTQNELVVNALGVLSQHLVVLLDAEAIVESMHVAYDRITSPPVLTAFSWRDHPRPATSKA